MTALGDLIAIQMAGAEGMPPGDRGFPEARFVSAAEAPEVKLGDLEALRGVVKFPVRIKCATLSWNTLAEALNEVTEAD